MKRASSRHWGILVILAVWLTIELLGLDFGGYGEEDAAFTVLTHMYRHGRLPPSYATPSFMLDLMALVALPVELLKGHGVESGALLLPTRAVFVGFVGLSLVGVYGLALTLSGQPRQAVLAALLLGGSWEVSYHARWVATEALVSTWLVFILWALCAATQKGSQRLLLTGAALAGAATSTNYAAGVLVIPVLLALWFLVVAPSVRWRLLVSSAVALVGAFLLLTPGALFHPIKFATEASKALHEQFSVPVQGFQIPPGLHHLGRLLEYLGLFALTAERWCAVVATCLALVGVVTLARKDRRLAALVCSPLLLVAYVSLQPSLIVRNVVWLTPVLATLSAHGIARAVDALETRVLKEVPGLVPRLAVPILMAALVVPGFVISGVAALGIRWGVDGISMALHKLRHGGPPGSQVTGMLRRSAGLSKRYVTMFDPDTPASVVYALGSELSSLSKVRSDPRLLLGWLGPREVNLNYYPTWSGGRGEHIVYLTHARAVELTSASKQASAQ